MITEAQTNAIHIKLWSIFFFNFIIQDIPQWNIQSSHNLSINKIPRNMSKEIHLMQLTSRYMYLQRKSTSWTSDWNSSGDFSYASSFILVFMRFKSKKLSAFMPSKFSRSKLHSCANCSDIKTSTKVEVQRSVNVVVLGPLTNPLDVKPKLDLVAFWKPSSTVPVWDVLLPQSSLEQTES